MVSAQETGLAEACSVIAQNILQIGRPPRVGLAFVLLVAIGNRCMSAFGVGADGSRLAERYTDPVIRAPRNPTRTHGAGGIKGQIKFIRNIGRVCHGNHCAADTQIEYRTTNQLLAPRSDNSRSLIDFRALKLASLLHVVHVVFAFNASILKYICWQFLERTLAAHDGAQTYFLETGARLVELEPLSQCKLKNISQGSTNPTAKPVAACAKYTMTAIRMMVLMRAFKTADMAEAINNAMKGCTLILSLRAI